jgi:uncharacterized protein (TIGR02757 family)
VIRSLVLPDQPLETGPRRIARQTDWLETLYRRFHRREHVGHDPLTFLYRYPDPGDREIVAILAGSLAYGNVRTILASVGRLLEPMGSSPRQFLLERSDALLARRYRAFRHRVTGPGMIIGLMRGLRHVIQEYNSIENAMCASPPADTITRQQRLVQRIEQGAGIGLPHLLPQPIRGSACKRLNLAMRWLVRCDNIDPGGWTRIRPADLLAPVDVHLLRMAHSLGWTTRRQADLKTAHQITTALRRFKPADPLRYDFALTRPGILRQLIALPPAGD